MVPQASWGSSDFRVGKEGKGSDISADAHPVIPAKAGIHPLSSLSLYKPLIQGAMGFARKVWIPAFAGMTRRGFRGDDGMGSVATHTNS